MTTDGAAAMQGSQKGVIKKIQELSPNCFGIHCILHREALLTKKLKLNADKAGGQQNELCNVLWEAGLRTRSIFISSLSSSSACFTSSSPTFSFFRVQVRVLQKFIKFFRV